MVGQCNVHSEIKFGAHAWQAGLKDSLLQLLLDFMKTNIIISADKLV